MDNIYQECIELLKQREVTLDDMAEIVMDIQKQYIKDLTYDQVMTCLNSVLHKREVQYAILTGISIDTSAEKGLVTSKNLQKQLMTDGSLYGVDEVLAYGICNLYGSIALTNFGYLDKVKPKIVEKLNTKAEGKCNVFLDDIVSAIIASTASKLAHGASNQ